MGLARVGQEIKGLIWLGDSDPPLTSELYHLCLCGVGLDRTHFM